MTIPYWPPDLPQRLIQENYQQALGEGRLRTAMDAGPPKSRRRFSAVPKPISGQFFGTADAFARLERFWNEDTAGGTLPFLIPDQTRDGLGLDTGTGLTLLDDAGHQILNTAWWLTLFGDNPPSQTPLSGRLYRISLSLTVLP